MGRPSHSRALGLWMNGQAIGRWVIPRSGSMELTYDRTWVGSAEGRPLSLSLPMNLDGIPLTGPRVGFYFDNLLPDSVGIRQRLQSRFHTRSLDAFDLLEAIGRDCVGAVQLVPEGTEPADVRAISATRLDEAAVERILLGASAPAGGPSFDDDDDDDDDFRISIAGAQEKTALTRHKGHWCRPHGSTPTTHIFKLPLGLVGGRRMDMTHSLENEWLCAELLRGFGVPVALCEVAQFGSVRTLIVERFDRVLHSSRRYWLRLPQEDMCQATGTPGVEKYEAEGGPGLVEIANVLKGSEAREGDLETLLRAQLLFWMLAATDGHAKNFSLRILQQGRYRLTPLYDVLSAWPITGPRHNQLHPKKLKLAMALRGKNKHYRLTEITKRHFDETASKCGMRGMDAIIAEAVQKTPKVLDAVGAKLPRDFPPRVFETIAEGLQNSAKQLA